MASLKNVDGNNFGSQDLNYYYYYLVISKFYLVPAWNPFKSLFYCFCTMFPDRSFVFGLLLEG